MSIIVNSNRVIQSNPIGYELVDDDEIITPTYSVENWIRPTDWITVPTPATGSEIVSMLVGVYDSVPNFLTIRASSTFSINWGDGSSQIVGSSSYARKEFSFGSYSAETLTSDGFRQALVTVTPQTPETFTSFDLNETHSYQSTSYKPNILEIKMSGPNLTSLVLSNGFASSGIDRLRNFEFIGTHSITNFASLFSNAEALRKVKIDFGGVNNTSSMFLNCLNLREIDSDLTKLNLVTTMASMFSGCTSLNTLPTAINASSCTTMASMFLTCYNLQETPTIITTSNLTNTSSMFQTCVSLVKVNSFTTSNVTNMSSMFQTCRLIQTIPLLDTRWVTNFTSIFQDCGLLNSIPQLNTASASNMTSMFSGCRSLVSDRRTRGIPFLNTQNVTNMSSMFLNCQKIKTIPEFNTRWVTTFQSTFQGCFGLKEVPLLNTASASNMQSMFNTCRSLQTVPFFNTQNVTDFSSMFLDCFLLSEVPNFNMATASNLSNMFDCIINTNVGGGSLYTIPNFNLSTTAASINMNFFLAGQRNLTTIPQLNTSRVTSMQGTFYACYNLREFPTLNLSSVTTTYAMFSTCINLRRVGSLNMPVNTNMAFMFINCYTLQEIKSIFTSNSLTIVAECFRNCYVIKQIPQFNTTQVANTQATGSPYSSNGSGFYALFGDCWALQSEPGLTASNVRDFRITFQNCYSLKTAPSYNTSLATSFNSMFFSCRSLETVPIYNVTSLTDANAMFQNCYNITSVTFSNISTINGVSCLQTFINCIKLRTVSIPGIRVTNPAQMFNACNSLVNVGTFSVVSVQGGNASDRGYYQMFLNCLQLTNLSGLTFSPSPLSNAQEFRDMFSGCNSLTETPYFSMTNSGDPFWQTGMFTNCNSLSIINATDNKFNLSFQGCNLNYNNIISEIGSFQTYSTITNLANRTINFEGNPGLPEMMNFWKRKLLYDKGYTYSSGTYNWTNLNLYVQAGDTYSYTDGSTTLFDVSGLSFSTNTSPTFSNSISITNGALLNTPTFNTNYLEFDGTNEAINFGTFSSLLTTLTIFAVIEPLTLPAGATVSIFGRYGASGEDNYFLDFTDGRLRFGFKQSATSTRPHRILNRTFNINQKYFVAACYNNTSASLKIWVDAFEETSYFSNTLTSNFVMETAASSILSIAGNVAASSSYANIRVYAAGIYNRILTQEQIEELQSFFRRQGIL